MIAALIDALPSIAGLIGGSIVGLGIVTRRERSDRRAWRLRNAGRAALPPGGWS